VSDAERSRDELLAELRDARERLAAPEVAAAGRDAHESGRAGRVLEHLRAAMFEVDAHGRLVYVSPTITDLTGYLPQELVGRPGFEWVHADDRPEVIEAYRKLLVSGEPARAVYRTHHRDGRTLWLETAASTYPARDGTRHVVAFTRDVTDRQQADQALRSSEHRLRNLTEHAADVICETDPEGHLLFLSPNAERVLGYPEGAFLGRSVFQDVMLENVHPDDRGPLVREMQAHSASRTGGTLAYRFRTGDGRWRWFESRWEFFETLDGAPRSVVVSRDVTERVQAEEDLRRSQQRFQMLAERSHDLIVELDDEGRLLYASPAALPILGVSPEQIVGTTPFGIIHPEDIQRAADSFLEAKQKRNRGRPHLFRIRHADGQLRWVEGVGLTYDAPDGSMRVLAVVRDITERRRAEEARRALEERSLQAQKLESLGVLAGGIAHDFNDLLTPILGDARLALRELPADSPARERLRRVRRAAERAASLTSQLLAYAGTESMHPERVDLSRIVRDLWSLLEAAVTPRAVFVFDLPDALPAVEGDSAQISQMVMNLVTNASEAVGDESGQIAIRTGTAVCDRAYLERVTLGSELTPGRHVFLEIADTGCGMDAEMRAKIFDPFFTTKFTGRGLGLAAVLGIARGHQGAIEVDTAPGRGTRVRILFPEAPPDGR